MTVLRNDGRWDKSNVMYADGQVKLYDKHYRTAPAEAFHFIDYGLSALSRTALALRVPAHGVSDLADVFFDLSRAGALAGLEVQQRFYEVGSPTGLLDFEAWLQRQPKGLVILDRDGVLNRMRVDAQGAEDSPMADSEVEVFPWVPRALKAMCDAGFGLCIASNQPAAAKGKTTRAALEAVHRRVLAEATSAGARILSSHICWHRAKDRCSCRKPAPGLLQEALRAHPDHAWRGAWMVGDRATDVQAGEAAGVRTRLLTTAPGSNLEAFAAFLLSGQDHAP